MRDSETASGQRNVWVRGGRVGGAHQTEGHGVRKGEGDKVPDGGFDPFIVEGREVERSVVTGRLAANVLRNEGVEGFVERKGWKGVVE